MLASAPLSVYPLTVTVLPVPTFLELNTPLPVPPRLTLSVPRALTLAVPLNVSATVAS